LTPVQRLEIGKAAARVTERSRSFFSGLSTARMERAESKARYTSDTFVDHYEAGAMLTGALEVLESALALTRGKESAGDAADVDQAVVSLARRARELRDDLALLIRAGDPDFVYYVETRGRGLLLRAAPIDVSRLAKEALFDRMRTIVLTSATLAVDGSFEYVKNRLGLSGGNEVRVPSEFDYTRQALMYLPRRIPSPKSPGFGAAAAREAIEILKRSRGRAFVLFTSYAMLRAVEPFVAMALPYPVLVQGTAPRSTLIEQFRATPNAILLATASFWQGVDVVGDQLSCVIVDKLPFASPGDPVTAARIEAVRERGGDPFADYQVPLAILALQQGLGRLIRHRTDRGVLAVLDPRLRTMAYGRRFLDSLPPAPVTHELKDVERFFG
jgi:ATP-dependent DNA helicase DinG